MKARPIAVLNYIMLFVFMFSAAVQYNDPDSLIWIIVYLLASLLCFLAILGKLPWTISALLALITLIWALTILPGLWGKVRIGDIFSSMQMKTLAVERAREFGGLLIISVWMAVLSIVVRRNAN